MHNKFKVMYQCKRFYQKQITILVKEFLYTIIERFNRLLLVSGSKWSPTTIGSLQLG